MEKWKSFQLSKEEEEGVTIEAEEGGEDEIFQRTLAGKLWTDNSFNSRAFTSTMISAWRLKNPVEVQELNKNLFLFRFASKRDLEGVLRNGPWSFDRNILVLARVSGDEQPSDLNMHFGTFWVRVYELPLKLRSETMAKKLGGILGEFEEMDLKEAHRNGRFLRLKVKVDLKQPLKRGTVVRFKEKNLRVHFKYERLPTFCFICGHVGHQLKDCESVGELSEEGFEDLEEQDLSYGAWLRASPLPRTQEDSQRRGSNTSSCSKSLFNISSGQSRCETKEKGKEVEEGEVEQGVGKGKASEEKKGVPSNRKEVVAADGKNLLEIEAMAESLGAVDISKVGKEDKATKKMGVGKRKKWIRKTGARKNNSALSKKMEVEMGKRNLIDVMVIDGTIEGRGSGEKKLKADEAPIVKSSQGPEVVLEVQHRLQQ
ncbi:uncharacterized protein LOC131650847 [Vicia villosa]|uniref:uncharacterized protein LOC131650847 n=1 Tax=Vicia villosa TaxID=3911 RepID=UPI00273B632A|nr:uncharacterized protein LOC131650847 [Vicia villosa]